MNAEMQFADAIELLGNAPGIQPPMPGATGFGARTLRVNGKIAAMLVDDRLVIKLAAERVNELIDSGEGEPYDGGKGHGRPMREWVSLRSGSSIPWETAMQEAVDFARAH